MRILEWRLSSRRRISRTSAAQRTKLAATKSKPSSTPKSRSSLPPAHIRHRERHARHVHTLFRLHLAAVFHTAAHPRAPRFQHRQAHQPVVEQDRIPGVDVCGLAQRLRCVAADDILGRECERLPRLQVYGAGAQLRRRTPPAPSCRASPPRAGAVPRAASSPRRAAPGAHRASREKS